MATESPNRVAPFWRDLAILTIGFIPAFFFGVNFGHSTAPTVANATPAAATAPVPKALTK